MKFQKYNRIDTIEKLEALDAYLMDRDTPKFKLMAMDTETNGLHIKKATVVGFSLSVDRHQGFYIPLLDWVPIEESLKSRKIKKVQYESYMDGYLECPWDGKRYPEFVTPKEFRPHPVILHFAKRWFSNVNLIETNGPFDTNMILENWGIDFSEQLFVDTALLSHILNENSPNGLKETAAEWKDELGFNPHAAANVEQQELGESVIRNGGTYNARTKHVWRASKDVMCKYACADTFLTYGVYEVGMQKFIQEFGPEMLPWFFEEEVMPLCKEVVIPMKRHGVYIDVPYFTNLQKETSAKLLELEDKIISIIAPHLEDFSIGKSMDEAVSNQKLVKKIIELEGLAVPKKFDKKSNTWKESLAKAVVQKEYQEEPHWIWGYILGEDEIKYSDKKLRDIKNELYQDELGRRYRFNIGSDAHLRWLFCDKLGMSKTDLPQTDSATKANPIPSMKAEVLKDHMLGKFEWVKDLLVFKKLRKLQSTYINPAVELNIDGWLYMDWKQNGTISGRFSCSGGFNLQTLPRVEEIDRCPSCDSEEIHVEHPVTLLADLHCKACNHNEMGIICSSAIKRGFIAPPGYKIVNADFESLEPKCFAYVSGDDKLKDVYRKGLDLYSKVYCDMMQEEYRSLKKTGETDKRNMIKPVVLGIPYGARDPQVANLMGLRKTYTDKQGVEKETLDVEKGAHYRKLYLSTYENLAQYMKDQELKCVSKGYVQSLVGRRRHFQYAPFIYELIGAYGVDVDSFLDMKYNDLEKPETTIGLDKKGLEVFAKRFKMKYADIAEKGFWTYVRGLFKNEYNNAKNWPIQTLAGHMANRGMVETTRRAKEVAPGFILVIQVHDEIGGYAPLDQVDKAAECLKLGMEENKYAKMIDIPMVADPMIADNLMEAK